MCSPMLVFAGLTAATAATESFAALQKSKAQSAEYKARALYNERQAQAELVKGKYEAARIREKGERVFGKQRALIGQSGVELEGSATNVILDSVKENELDVQAVQWGQQIASQNYLYEAKVDRMNSKSARTAGYFAAITPLLKGATSISGQYVK